MHATTRSHPPPAAQHDAGGAFHIRRVSLFHEGRALAFPGDANGGVDCDRLSRRARLNDSLARARVGRAFATPAVRPAAMH